MATSPRERKAWICSCASAESDLSCDLPGHSADMMKGSAPSAHHQNLARFARRLCAAMGSQKLPEMPENPAPPSELE